MGQQTLQTIIAISGRVDNSFGQIGEALIGLGSQIDGISQKIIDFGKESVETYVKYDDAMRETQAVGGYTAAEMEKLDALNRQIAQTTTYSNLQSANAMVLIAQAGMGVEDTYSLLPSVLDLAMAGNLDLADSVDYLLSSLTSMGYGMEYASTLTDQMAKTAAIGMTDIDTLGESMMRLGSASGEFFSSSEEILTILSAMSQFGHDQRGAQAGTWLRNFMLSLAAPAGSIDDIVDAMEQLGIAQEEIDAYAENKSNGQAAMAVQSLMEQGLKVYDEHGKLLPAIDIIKSLRDTVRGSAEYSQDLTELTGALNAAGGDIDSFLANTEGLTDNALYNVFAKIFGKRGITTAMNLISISDEEWDQTFAEIVNADGFAQSMSDTMQGGLGGALRELEAAYTEFQTTIGESLAPAVENVAGWLKEIVTSLSNMDEGALDALVSQTSVIAAAGPGLLLVGGAFRMIGHLLTPGGKWVLAAMGITMLASAIKALDEADFANQFGDLKLDPSSFTEYVDSLGTSFETAYADVNEFNTALGNAVTQYTTASETFKTNLITNMLTGATLTADDIATLEGLGDQMHAAIMSGIENNYAADMQTITNAFGGDELAQEDSTWSHIIQVLEIGFNNVVSRANELSQELREAMTSAFDDGTLTGDEIAGIQSIMDEMNEVMAMQTSADNYAAQQTLLRKAQTMGLDSLQELSDLEKERQDQVMESLYAAQDSAYGNLAATLDYQVAHGTVLEDGTVITREYADQLLADLKTRQASEASKYHENFIPFTMSLYEEAIGSSDLGDTWEGLRGFADSVLAKGTITESDYNAYQNGYGLTERNRVAELSKWYVDALGGYDQIMADVADLQATQGKTADKIAADAATANRLLQMLTMYDLSTVNGYGGLADTEQTTAYASVNGYSAEEARRQAESLDDSGMMELAWDYMRDAIERGYSFDFENLMSGNFTDTGYQSGLQSIVDRLKEVYDFGAIEIPKGLESIADYYAAYQLMYGDINPEDYLIGAVKTPEVTEYSAEIAKQTIAAVGGGMDAYLAEIGNGQDARDVNAAWSEMSREARTEYQNMVDALQEVYDFDRVLAGETNMFAEASSAFRDDAAVYSLLYGNASHDLEKYKITAEIDPVIDEGAVQDAAGSQEIKVPVEPEVPEDTGELEMPSTVTGAAEAAQAAHSDAQIVMDDPLAQAVHVSDNGSAAATRGAIASTFSTPITQYINVVQRGGGGLMNRLAKYADGGRADEPSIFGEAGPEWAIPEEHSERTAWLLDAARQASGFTWPELLTRNGGLNAGGGNTPSQLIYSPTIIANDANGVEQRLIEDKARLEKWYQDKQLHDDVEVYA